MDKHYGQIVEYRVRRKGVNITELANALRVNRRTVYNCFADKYLNAQIIHKIGCIIQHDFSKEFTELFTTAELDSMLALKIEPHSVPNNEC